MHDYCAYCLYVWCKFFRFTATGTVGSRYHPLFHSQKWASTFRPASVGKCSLIIQHGYNRECHEEQY